MTLECLLSLYNLQESENLVSKCTAAIPTEVEFKTDGVEYSLSNKGINVQFWCVMLSVTSSYQKPLMFHNVT